MKEKKKRGIKGEKNLKGKIKLPLIANDVSYPAHLFLTY
jgi:hypothetical protein